MTGGVSCPKPSYKKPKPEKVQKIKLQDAKDCWFCHTTQNLERHHVFKASNRKNSERYNLVVWLCGECHRGNNGVHFNIERDGELKQIAQYKFEQIYGRAKFMNVFGRSYL